MIITKVTGKRPLGQNRPDELGQNQQCAGFAPYTLCHGLESLTFCGLKNYVVIKAGCYFHWDVQGLEFNPRSWSGEQLLGGLDFFTALCNFMFWISHSCEGMKNP